MEKITVIVPCYNEEAALHYYYKEMSRVMDEMNDVDFELLFVNDGSKDKTLEIMMELANKDSRVKYISFSRKFSMDLKLLCSFSLIKVSATPSLLARAVRPIRCT